MKQTRSECSWEPRSIIQDQALKASLGPHLIRITFADGLHSSDAMECILQDAKQEV